RWPEAPGDPTVGEAIRTGDEKFLVALANDLNTAEARAAIFDVLRAVNAAADQNRLTRADAEATLTLLAKFDSIFAVLEDHDADLTRQALAWAETEGRLSDADPEVIAKFGSEGLSEADI